MSVLCDAWCFSGGQGQHCSEHYSLLLGPEIILSSKQGFLVLAATPLHPLLPSQGTPLPQMSRHSILTSLSSVVIPVPSLPQTPAAVSSPGSFPQSCCSCGPAHPPVSGLPFLEVAFLSCSCFFPVPTPPAELCCGGNQLLSMAVLS